MSEVEVIAEVGSIQVCGLLSSSGSLATLASMRRASSRVRAWHRFSNDPNAKSCSRLRVAAAASARARIGVGSAMAMTHHLRRAAVYESGHCIAALHYSLPLLGVAVNADGSGATKYARRLGPAEVECWAH